ncbi:putative F-box protein At1g33530 [Salvia splendens]|uniref:putative F-box protein At1g33530 n=1 Tax=Salvia splendens TaxID=180675 RepID=UPI001C271818|nr:putative F-box protein At1g33530 [Salvia splendens]
MNKSAPTALRRSNRLAKRDHLALRKEQKRKDRHVAVREERKERDISLTTKEDSVKTGKCVLKSWRHPMEGDEFAMSYTPKPGLTFVHQDLEKGYTVRDEALKQLFRFGLPSHHLSSGAHSCVRIASANGLILVWDPFSNILFICNPMTREYVELPPLSKDPITCFFGFGVSRTSGQYKILCVDVRSCYVYTLGRGAGLWRSIAPAPSLGIGSLYLGYATFFNGNLHRLASDSEENYSVCCFDLETELFTRISYPCDYIANRYGNRCVYILDGRLCLYNILDWCHVIVWKMNNYGMIIFG